MISGSYDLDVAIASRTIGQLNASFIASYIIKDLSNDFSSVRSVGGNYSARAALNPASPVIQNSFSNMVALRTLHTLGASATVLYNSIQMM